MNLKLVLGIILAGMAAVFIIQNVSSVDLTFLFWTLSMSRALLMLLILSLGFILGWLLHGSFRRMKTITLKNKALLRIMASNWPNTWCTGWMSG
jgi:lipopolysaccharide assembly protein A